MVGEVIKICKKCLKDLPIVNFRKRRDEKGCFYYRSWCKKCEKEYRRVYFQKNKRLMYKRNWLYLKNNPWSKTLNRIVTRVRGKYRKLGIKNYLNSQDLKFLWFRDKAYLMQKPAIHRIDNTGDYTLENCKYMENSEHDKLHHQIRKNTSIKLWRIKGPANCGDGICVEK